jgi:hypothetical protein
MYLDISLAHGWRRVEGTPSVELRLGGDDAEYGVEVGTQGAKLVCVEADLKLTERAAFCQGVCLEDDYPQTLRFTQLLLILKEFMGCLPSRLFL